MEKGDLGGDFFEEQPSESRESSAQNFLSYHLLDSFACFFPQTVKERGISYHECYQRVMRSDFLFQKMRMPTPDILKANQLSLSDRSRQIYHRSAAHERFYIQTSSNEAIYKYALGQEKQQQIQQLQRQLELYRRNGEDALAERRRQLKQARQEQERIREREEEERRRRAAVLAGLNWEKVTQ